MVFHQANIRGTEADRISLHLGGYKFWFRWRGARRDGAPHLTRDRAQKSNEMGCFRTFVVVAARHDPDLAQLSLARHWQAPHDAGPFLRFSVTYEADNEAAEDALMAATADRLAQCKLVF